MRARFSAPVQTGPGAYPAFCIMGTGSFPGVKRPGRGADHPPPSKRRGHERVELYLYSPSGPQWPVIGRTFTFTFTANTKKELVYYLCRKNITKNYMITQYLEVCFFKIPLAASKNTASLRRGNIC